MPADRPFPPSSTPRRVLRRLTCCLCLGSASILSACADVAAPERSPDVFARTAGTAASDTTAPGSTPPTTPVTPTPPNTPASAALSGTVVDVPSDSTQSWRTVGGVRLELGTREGAGAIAAVASTTSDTDGRFTFDQLTLPTGLLYVRAAPTDARYRTTRWIAAYTLTGPLLRDVELGWSVGPYVVLERRDAPQRAHAPVLVAGKLMANAIPVPGTVNGYVPVPDATVLISLPSGAATNPDSVPARATGLPLASARTDAGGRFLVQLPGPGTYQVRATTEVGSPFASMTNGYHFVARASAEATEISWLQFRLDRR